MYWIVKGLVRQYYYKNNKELTEHMAVENSIVMCIESLFKEKPTHLNIMTLERFYNICNTKATIRKSCDEKS